MLGSATMQQHGVSRSCPASTMPAPDGKVSCEAAIHCACKGPFVPATPAAPSPCPAWGLLRLPRGSAGSSAAPSTAPLPPHSPGAAGAQLLPGPFVGVQGAGAALQTGRWSFAPSFA